MRSVVSTLADLAAPWAGLYNNSSFLSTAVTFGHLGGMLLAGGFAIAADRATLRFVSSGPASEQSHLSELRDIHRPVLVGLAVTFLSGMLLLAADVESLLLAPVFWVKMGLILGLIGNGVLLRRWGGELRSGSLRPERAWRGLRASARLSLTLWFASLLLGTALLSA